MSICLPAYVYLKWKQRIGQGKELYKKANKRNKMKEKLEEGKELK